MRLGDQTKVVFEFRFSRTIQIRIFDAQAMNIVPHLAMPASATVPTAVSMDSLERMVALMSMGQPSAMPPAAAAGGGDGRRGDGGRGRAGGR